MNIVYFMIGSTIFNRLGVAVRYRQAREIMTKSANQLITTVFREQRLALPGSANKIVLELHI